jgi:hypothetical protein
MTTPLLIQSAASSIVVYLELSTFLPAESLTYADVTAGLKKEGGVFASFTLTAGNFTNLGDGFYEIDLTAGNTDTLGSLYLNVSGATIRTSLTVARVALAAAAVPTPSAGYVPTTTTLFGYIYGQTGAASEGATVYARTVAKPTVLHPVDQGILITDAFVTTVTDSTGFFSMDLLTGAQVEVVIADANYRRVITVPASSSNLFDLA